MNKEKILQRLCNDEDYYGKFGQQYLSNSDIKTLLKNPLALHEPSKASPAFLVGGYFHTCILEPDKLEKFKVIPSATRNTKVYKDMSGGELCLLQKEVDDIVFMRDKIMANDICKDLIQSSQCEYEQPGIINMFGNDWKGKADIVNHDERLIIDLKTTSDIDRFKWSATKFNYDSQAYIYSRLFGYEMLFMVIDKETLQIGLFDCSPDFYKSGEEKVRKATDAYDLFYKTDDFDSKQYLITKTL